MFVMVMNRNPAKPRVSYVNSARVEQMVEEPAHIDENGAMLWRVVLETGHLLVNEKDMERLLEALGDLDELAEGRDYTVMEFVNPESKTSDKAG